MFIIRNFGSKSGLVTVQICADEQGTFEKVYELLQQTFNLPVSLHLLAHFFLTNTRIRHILQNRLSADEQADETSSRTSSMLLTLSAIACHSVTCQQKAIFAVVQMSVARSLEVDVVLKVRPNKKYYSLNVYILGNRK